MKQFNTYALYKLANDMAPLRTIPLDVKQLNRAHGFTLYFANYSIQQFFVETRVVPLELSSDAAKDLSKAIEVVAGHLWADPVQDVNDWEVRNVYAKFDELEAVLALELARHQTYLVSQVGGYSMPLLVTKAEVNILEDALAVIGDQAKKDFREAGRCLAFELPTAAGFHSMRATEDVLRQYYALVTKKPTDRIEWHTCIQELKKASGNLKVIQVLDQIRDLHRNPLMHPQDFLSMKEAISLFDIAKSAIGSMAEEITRLQELAADEQAILPLESATNFEAQLSNAPR